MTPQQFIKKYKPKCFYHFTDVRNLDNIKMHGLLSFAELVRRRIVVPVPGGNDWSHEEDKRRGLDEYIHLCFLDEHPMEYRVKQEGRIVESRFLKISTEIIHQAGVMFTPDVSNKSGVKSFDLKEACRVMDFSVIYERTDWTDPEVKKRRLLAKKYELLFPNPIPLKFISGF